MPTLNEDVPEMDRKSTDKNDAALEATTNVEVGEILASDYTEQQYKKLTRKIDYYLMPMMFFFYGIQQTDKTSTSIQALFGMEDELKLHGQQYQWLTTIAVQNWSQLMALRALQGFFESNISPGFLLITGLWYRTEEHANRSLFWQSSEGFFSIVCNLILYAIARHVEAHGGIAAWRCISLFLGSLTLAGAVAAFFLLGCPHEVRWLNDDEKRMAGITTFSSLMYETFGFNDWQSMLYGCPRNAIYVVVFLVVGLYTRKFQNQRMWVMIASCIIPFIGLLVMSLLPNTPQYKWIKWGMYIMTVVFSLAIFLGWSLIPSNVAGKTKQTVVSAMTLIAYCAGNMAGAQVFKTKDAPRYVSGTVACSVCFALEAIVILLWRGWYMWENRRRERIVLSMGISKEEQERRGKELGEQDVTDMKNIYFRYTM
ncbi:hypothetical protein AnigIFM56816_006628 [Aspergillus niger]|nr:hypothetical protein AnigIFM56816_006628 [Aspergillus niger]